MSSIEPEAALDAPLNEKQLSQDARAFGIEVADSVQTELEGEANEERLQATQVIFLQAVEHIEKQYGSDAAETWTDEANEAMRLRFAELNNLLGNRSE